MPRRYRFIFYALFFAFAAVFLQCNLAVQSYNFGKLLVPGEGSFIIGGGPRRLHYVYENEEYTIKCDPGYSNNCSTVNYTTQKAFYDTVPAIALAYRVGILSKAPFGKGLEMGFLAEGPVQLYSHAAALLEIDARAGFPVFVLGKGIYHHNVGVGWVIGAWIDNGWYAEYAAGWEYKWLIPYAGFRAAITATDFSRHDIFDYSYDDENYEYKGIGKLAKSNHGFLMRATVGLRLIIPDIPAVPNFISPEVSVLFPQYIANQNAAFYVNLGFGW